MLAFKQLKIAAGKRNLFEAEDINLVPGITALVGRNGAGKSTLLKAIIGLHTNYEGTIAIDGQAINQFSQKELASKIAIVYSKATIFGNHTGRDMLLLGRLPYQNMFSIASKNDHEIVNKIIVRLKLESFVDRVFMELSDGEKQLIMIGRAMVQDTTIILLDEPGAFLDLVNRHQLMTTLKEIATDTDKMIVFSTHEIGFLEHVCNNVLLIDQKNLRLLKEQKQFSTEIYKSFGIEKMGNYEV